MHLKLPSSLMHMPFRHMLVVAHSSWSGGIESEGEFHEGGGLFVVVSAVAPHRCSSFRRRWAQSQRCRCTESCPLCWRSGHCGTSLRSRYTHRCLKTNIFPFISSLYYSKIPFLWSDLPIHACLVGVPWYPSWHLQWYDPGVLTQSPLMHGLFRHSSTSDHKRQLRTWGFLHQVQRTIESDSSNWQKMAAQCNSPVSAGANAWGSSICGCCVLTDTLPSDVLLVAHVALAAVAWSSRYAASVQAQVC